MKMTTAWAITSITRDGGVKSAPEERDSLLRFVWYVTLLSCIGKSNGLTFCQKYRPKAAKKQRKVQDENKRKQDYVAQMKMILSELNMNQLDGVSDFVANNVGKSGFKTDFRRICCFYALQHSDCVWKLFREILNNRNFVEAMPVNVFALVDTDFLPEFDDKLSSKGHLVESVCQLLSELQVDFPLRTVSIVVSRIRDRFLKYARDRFAYHTFCVCAVRIFTKRFSIGYVFAVMNVTEDADFSRMETLTVRSVPVSGDAGNAQRAALFSYWGLQQFFPPEIAEMIARLVWESRREWIWNNVFF